tara:strand:+ start:436 stop:906 length:471 start_codon:yes stop_codon:yes gene_type:complete
MDISNESPVSSDRLQQAYAALMERAPSALFRKARQLYLNKYCLDGREPQGALRLYVQQEKAEERIEPCLVEKEPRRLAIYTVQPITLALVHWQQPQAADPAEQAAYLQQWGLDGIALHPQSELWFREGGHHSLLPAPSDLLWRKESLLPELSRELD